MPQLSTLPSEVRPSYSPGSRGSPVGGVTLIEVVVIPLLVLFAFTVVNWLGLGGVAFALRLSSVILVAMFVWSCAYVRAPEVTKYATVLLLIGSVTFSLMPCWIVHARTQARRNHSQIRLRQIGWAISEARNGTWRPPNIGQPIDITFFKEPRSSIRSVAVKSSPEDR